MLFQPENTTFQGKIPTTQEEWPNAISGKDVVLLAAVVAMAIVAYFTLVFGRVLKAKARLT